MGKYAQRCVFTNFERENFGMISRKLKKKMTRREAREAVFGLLFEREFRADETAEAIFESSVENREIPADAYVRKAYFAICEHEAKIDKIIGENSVGWKTDRLTNVSRSIMRLCVYELMFEEDIPTSVSLNEAVELAKKYDEEKARPFINGVLNAVKNALEAKNG